MCILTQRCQTLCNANKLPTRDLAHSAGHGTDPVARLRRIVEAGSWKLSR